MTILILGLILFIGTHSMRIFVDGWRANFITQFGTNTWKLVFSLISVAGLVLLIYGYGLTRQDPVFLWNPPIWTRHLAMPLVWIAFVLVAATYVPGNGIKPKLGHPMYAGIKLWAVAHLLANGRLGDVVLFGVFLLWAVLGFARSRRRDRAQGLIYPAGTMGRTILTVVVGTLAWALFVFWLHRLLIGVPPL